MLRLSSIPLQKGLPVLISLIAIIILLFIPDFFTNDVYKNHVRVDSRIISVDNSSINTAGIITYGDQLCMVEVLSGQYKGLKIEANNILLGRLDTDKLYQPEDVALVVLSPKIDSDEIIKATLIDHYRLGLEAFLVIAFVILLISLAGWIGVRAIISFIFTVLAIWKILIPLILLGYDPVVVGLILTITLTLIITMLVYGFNRCFFSSVLGALSGSIITALMALYFVNEFKIHGAIMNYSENLLYSGYTHINLTKVFIASIFIASSGAVMDVAVDITSAVNEVVAKKPDISKSEAIKSGLTVGRAVIGTMTTTLLLAYSGGYLALLMVFVAQGLPMINILNYNYVAAEILHTMVGSFGLITVVPFTAITSGLLLAKHQ